MFQISNDPHGYVVEVNILDSDGVCRWHPLRNFGDRQGDARAFKEFDCPELNDNVLRALIKRYDPDVKYMRVEKHRFAKIRKA
jgi:hypothetical protein